MAVAADVGQPLRHKNRPPARLEQQAAVQALLGTAASFPILCSYTGRPLGGCMPY